MRRRRWRRSSAATRAAFARVRPLLEARERAGLVRRCHGDLHLGNIVLLDGEPTLFDAIEFDPRIATGDVFYDLAFLLMDLIERDLARRRPISCSTAISARRAGSTISTRWPRCRCSCRCAPRSAPRSPPRAPSSATSAREAEQSARDYFALAQTLLAPPPPQLVAVGGLSGTGKSLLARALAPDLAPAPGAVVLRSDVERKALFGVAETERLPQQAYERKVTARVYAALDDKARRVLAAGHSAIADAVFADADERAAIARAAGAAAFHGLFLTADLATRLARVGARARDASDADAAVARAQEQYDLGALDWDDGRCLGRPGRHACAGAQGALGCR